MSDSDSFWTRTPRLDLKFGKANIEMSSWSLQSSPLSKEISEDQAKFDQDRAAIEYTGKDDTLQNSRLDGLSETPAEADPFQTSGSGVEYRTMSWWHVGILAIAEFISLGILALPSAVAALGLIPGLLAIVLFGLLATYAGYVIGQFKLRFPSVFNMADAGYILLGTFGYHLLFWATLLSLIFIMAAHIVTFAAAMENIAGKKTCSIVWMVVGFAISAVLTTPRTLKKVSFFSIASSISVVAAVVLVITYLGVTSKISPLDNTSTTTYQLFLTSYNLKDTVLALLNITIAYTGNVAFFSFISELRNPTDFTKSLAFLQGFSITLYALVAALIYVYVGSGVPSPALGAVPSLIKKIAYGIAMPTIIIAGVINAHIVCKQLYLTLWCRWKHDPAVITSRDAKAWGSWIAIVVSCWAIALVIALGVPIFEQMLGLISALFGSWFTYGICGMFWFKLNWHRLKQVAIKKIHLYVLNIILILTGAGLCGLGLYTSGSTIKEDSSGSAFSCHSV